MEITKEIKDTMGALSKVNLDFLHFVEQEPDCLKRENFSELEELRNKLHYLQAWPTFLGEETKKKFREAGVEIFNLIKSIPGRLFQNDTHKMSDFYQLPVSVLDLQMEGSTQEHLDQLIGPGRFYFFTFRVEVPGIQYCRQPGRSFTALVGILIFKKPLAPTLFKRIPV